MERESQDLRAASRSGRRELKDVLKYRTRFNFKLQVVTVTSERDATDHVISLRLTPADFGRS